MDAGEIEQVVDEAGQPLAAGIEPARAVDEALCVDPDRAGVIDGIGLPLCHAGEGLAIPAHDGDWRQQLVRRHLQEGVTDADRLFQAVEELRVLHGECRGAGEQPGIGKGVRPEAPSGLGREEGDRADDAVAADQRHDEDLLRAEAANLVEVLGTASGNRGRLLQHLVGDLHEDRLAAFEEVAHLRTRCGIGIVALQVLRQGPLGGVSVPDGDALGECSGLTDVDDAPVGDRRHGQLRDVAQRVLVIERRGQQRGGFHDDRQRLLVALQVGDVVERVHDVRHAALLVANGTSHDS